MMIAGAIIWGIILGFVSSLGVINIAVMTHNKLEDK